MKASERINQVVGVLKDGGDDGEGMTEVISIVCYSQMFCGTDCYKTCKPAVLTGAGAAWSVTTQLLCLQEKSWWVDNLHKYEDIDIITIIL